MKKRNLIKSMFIILIVSSLIAACNLSNNRRVIERKELHVAAAANLRFAFEEIGLLFEEEKEVKVIFQFGSSGNLAHQIANGAPMDLLIAADKRSVEDLIKSGDVLEETAAIYAMGRIVLAVNKNAAVGVKSLEDLLSDKIEYIAIANPNHAPYGMAAKEALESKGLWEAIEEKIVYGENISQTMQFVQTGNVPVSIIALSIANTKEMEYFLIEEELHNPLEQMLGIVSHTSNQELAKDFITFLSSAKGREVMEKYGFILPE